MPDNRALIFTLHSLVIMVNVCGDSIDTRTDEIAIRRDFRDCLCGDTAKICLVFGGLLPCHRSGDCMVAKMHQMPSAYRFRLVSALYHLGYRLYCMFYISRYRN